MFTFDESTGQRTSGEQDTRADTKGKKGEQQEIAVPWKEMFQLDLGRNMGSKEAGMAAALVVLAMLHKRFDASKLPIDIVCEKGKQEVRVVATEEIPAKTLQLPPCVPKSSKLVEHSTHPHRAAITVICQATNRAVGNQSDKATAGQESSAPDKAAVAAGVGSSDKAQEGETRVTYYVKREWKAPRLEDDEKTWTFQEDTSTHPFWAVRRLTPDQLKDLKDKTAQINATLDFVQYTNCAVGLLQEDSASFTHFVRVPMITNSLTIPKGGELILEGVKKDSHKKRDLTWKDAPPKPSLKKAKGESQDGKTPRKGSGPTEL